MKDGAVVSNSGHFNVEINIPAWRKWPWKNRAAFARSWSST
jgi:S-adenosylhomocysteine hydrolase